MEYYLQDAFTLGSDPEVFLTNKGNVIPSWTVLTTSSKDKNRGMVYSDGVQAEFEIKPTTQSTKWVEEIYSGVEYVEELTGCKVLFKDVVPTPPEFFKNAPPFGLDLGCNASRNIYGMMGEFAHARDIHYRFAGCHFHFGSNQIKIEPKDIQQCVRMLDLLVGIPSVALSMDENVIRRRYYGLAGEFRVPGIGRLEYRTISASAMKNRNNLKLLIDLAKVGMWLGCNGMLGILDIKETTTSKQIPNIINNLDVQEARNFIDSNHKQFENIFEWLYGKNSTEHIMGKLLKGQLWQIIL